MRFSTHRQFLFSLYLTAALVFGVATLRLVPVRFSRYQQTLREVF